MSKIILGKIHSSIFFTSYRTNIRLLFFVAMIILFFIHLNKIFSTNIFYFLPDEMGYLANGALLLGYDWSELKIPLFYSGGYSLIISFFMMFIQSPTVLYKVLCIFNAFLNCISFFFLYKILTSKYIFIFSKQEKKWLAIIIAFISMLYPALTLYTLSLQPECLLICLTLTSFYIFIKMNSSETSIIKWYCLEACCLGFMFMVHTRSLPVSITIISSLLLNAYFKPSKIKNIIVFFIIYSIIIGIGLYFKQYLLTNLYQYLDANGNLLSGNLYKLYSLFSVTGFKEFLVILEGHLYYIVVSTIGFSLMGFLNFLIQWLGKINRGNRDYCLFYFSLCISTILSLLMSVLYFTNSNEQGILFATYGRYFESSMGILSLALGITVLFDRRLKLKITFLWAAISIFVIAIFKFVVSYYHGTSGIADFQTGFLIFKVGSIFSYTLSAFFCFLLISVFFILRKSNELMKVCCFVLVGMFFISNLLVAKDAVNRNYRYKEMESVVQSIAQEKKYNENIYYYTDKKFVDDVVPWWNGPMDIQFLLYKSEAIKVFDNFDNKDMLDSSDKKKGVIISVNRKSLTDDIKEKGKIIKEYPNYVIWRLL